MAENTQAFSFESKKHLDTDQFENVIRIEAISDKPVKNVVCVNAIPKILSSEKVGEGLTYNGKTAYNIVYETEEGKLASCYAESEWQNKTTFKGETYFLCPRVEENVITGTSATEILISSLIDVDIYGIVSEVVTSVEGLGADYVVSERTYEYQKLVNTVSDNITEVAEQEIKEKLDDILYQTAEVRLLNATAGIDTITLEGEVLVTAYGLTDGAIFPYSKTLEFKQEIAALSSLPSHFVDASVKLSQLKVTASNGDEKSNLIFSAEVHADAVIYSNESTTVVEDVFSLTKNLSVNRTCTMKENLVRLGQSTASIVETVENEVELTELYFVAPKGVVLGQTTDSENGLTVSGFVNVGVVGKAETGEVVCLDSNIPYLAEIDDKNANILGGSVRVVSARLRSGRELEVNAEVTTEYRVATTDYVSCVADVEELEDKPLKNSAIRVYVVKENEDLFVIAKNLNMRPDDILAQNPDLNEGVNPGKRVVVYCQLVSSFN